MKELRKDKRCEKCNKIVNAVLVRNITMNGASQIYWYCEDGQHATETAHFIPHELVKQFVEIESLKVIKNYSGSELCAICLNPFTELHHFAPRHLFGDEADKWPAEYLCKAHHKEWHDKVTPEMCRRKENV